MRLLYKLPPTLEEARLYAWHHMINDPLLTTYTMVNGREHRKYVNPKLAWKRQLAQLTISLNAMAEEIRDRLFGPLGDLTKIMQRMQFTLEQSGLNPSFEGDKSV